MKGVHLAHRGVLKLEGEDRLPFLQGLITNDVTKLTPQTPLFAAFLTPQGKFLHDLFLTTNNGVIFIDCERERAEELLKKLMMYKLRSRITLTNISETVKVYALWGEEGTYPAETFKDPRLEALGRRVIYPATFTPPFPISPFKAYEEHRISLGIPDGSRDIEIAKGIILECGFDEMNAIDWKKGCYMGQELIARTHYRGLVRKRLLPLQLLNAEVRPESGMPLYLDDQEVGEMRTSAGAYGLGLVRLEILKEEMPLLRCGESQLKPFVPSWMRLPQQIS